VDTKAIAEEAAEEAGGEIRGQIGGTAQEQFAGGAPRRSSWFGDRFGALRLKRGAGL
jgi:hypothetical protein